MTEEAVQPVAEVKDKQEATPADSATAAGVSSLLSSSDEQVRFTITGASCGTHCCFEFSHHFPPIPCHPNQHTHVYMYIYWAVCSMLVSKSLSFDGASRDLVRRWSTRARVVYLETRMCLLLHNAACSPAQQEDISPC
jgi:hypothetical protein